MCVQKGRFIPLEFSYHSKENSAFAQCNVGSEPFEAGLNTEKEIEGGNERKQLGKFQIKKYVEKGGSRIIVEMKRSSLMKTGRKLMMNPAWFLEYLIWGETLMMVYSAILRFTGCFVFQKRTI